MSPYVVGCSRCKFDMKNGWECWSGGMAHPYFGREGRMGMGTVFKKDGREGRPSEKNGRYPSLRRNVI